MNALHCITEKSKRDDRGDAAVTHLLLPSMCSCARSVDAFYRVLSLTWIHKPYAHSIISKQGQTSNGHGLIVAVVQDFENASFVNVAQVVLAPTISATVVDANGTETLRKVVLFHCHE